MPVTTVDKVIVSNRGAQHEVRCWGRCRDLQSPQRLVAADLKRGHASIVIDIDDNAQMSAIGGAAVLGPTDQRGAKEAIDAIDKAHTPDYIMLLDGPDVIPHILLVPISGLTDPDKDIPSDLPCAFSRRHARCRQTCRACRRTF
ncbi:hypothetical protein NKI48_33190 [Mesorhizobium sp. M0644]|uniref:hypothetical protein n=1 Tax=Mesorhizobium sp. M0644 TaxID=2956979 RepID=UPI003338E14B